MSCVSCEMLPAASSSRQDAAASMCTTPGAAACSAPSSADSSPVGGPKKNKNGREKRGFQHISPALLASAPPSCTPGRCCGSARCQTFANTGDCATRLNRNPGVDERCGKNALLTKVNLGILHCDHTFRMLRTAAAQLR